MGAISTEVLVEMVLGKRMKWAEVEKATGLTRQGVWKRLKRGGLYEPRCAKGGAPGKMVEMACGFCQRPVRRYRSRMALMGQVAVYCNQQCYAAKLATHPYQESRDGSRMARVAIGRHFPIERDHMVHHKDGDQRNNVLGNLLVFASQADHMAHHRGRKVTPLFDGATIA